MKRGRGGGSESLTGGTADVNPQWMKIKVTQSGADTTTTQAQALPIIRAREGVTPTIIEVLKVGFEPTSYPEVDSTIQLILTTKNFSTTTVAKDEPSAVAYIDFAYKLTTSGEYAAYGPIFVDCTDGAGHGVLVATDNIYFQASSAGTSASNVGICWILYRFKRVGTLEYVGIVQSQQ